MSDTDWNAAKKDYEAGGKPRDLFEKYGCSAGEFYYQMKKLGALRPERNGHRARGRRQKPTVRKSLTVATNGNGTGERVTLTVPVEVLDLIWNRLTPAEKGNVLSGHAK